ncbi:DNA ligase [Candidatus Woesearchaeota archaeon]|nr:DNA ligase [Candidatus Woesearchaeota archaeon]
MIKPMLAVLGSPADLLRKGYIFEPKLDGIRAICHVDSRLKLVTRNGHDVTRVYPELSFREQIKAKSCVLDGEIVVYDDKGNPSFGLWQKRNVSSLGQIKELSKEYPAVYVAFDILEKDRKSMMKEKLLKRKEILKHIVAETRNLQLMVYTADGRRLWDAVKARNLEGVVAKRADSMYYSGRQVPDWIKIKNVKTFDAVIIGYTQKIRALSSLAMGLYVKGKLTYIGKVGTGFNERILEELYAKLKPLQTKAYIERLPPEARNVQWVKPKFVAEIKYQDFTSDMIARAPVFLRLRDDKNPRECTMEDL